MVTAREQSLNAVRNIMLRQVVGKKKKLTFKSKVDISRFSSCRNNFIPHVNRVNYRVAHYKRAGKAFVLFMFILHSRKRQLYGHTLDGTFALA